MEQSPSAVAYLLLLAVQVFGAIFIVWNVLPAFGQLAFNPGQQLRNVPLENYGVVASVLLMQGTYWYRLLCIKIPFHGPNVFLSHASLFLGRLTFVFGGSLFGLVFFRHIPELGPQFDLFVLVRRGLLLGVSLFALFCFTLELERLGRALANDRQN